MTSNTNNDAKNSGVNESDSNSLSRQISEMRLDNTSHNQQVTPNDEHEVDDFQAESAAIADHEAFVEEHGMKHGMSRAELEELQAESAAIADHEAFIEEHDEDDDLEEDTAHEE
ncbi:hypothetical protein HK405_011789 [Cladochytrium tenue]|nr:hypothetical protein HK405_011789 [Cladochytrium tenue]